MKNALKKATDQIDKEAEMSVHIILNAVLLVLKRKHGYGRVRLGRFLDEVGVAFREVGSTNEVSMIQLLDEETGVEIRCQDGSKWQDYPYLNVKMWDRKPPTYAKAIYIKQRMKKWVYPSILATMLLSLHRKFGWGPDRIEAMYHDINNLKYEYQCQGKDIRKAAEQETGITYEILNNTLWVHPYREYCKGCDWNYDKCLACETRINFDEELLRRGNDT